MSSDSYWQKIANEIDRWLTTDSPDPLRRVDVADKTPPAGYSLTSTDWKNIFHAIEKAKDGSNIAEELFATIHKHFPVSAVWLLNGDHIQAYSTPDDLVEKLNEYFHPFDVADLGSVKKLSVNSPSSLKTLKDVLSKIETEGKETEDFLGKEMGFYLLAPHYRLRVMIGTTYPEQWIHGHLEELMTRLESLESNPPQSSTNVEQD